VYFTHNSTKLTALMYVIAPFLPVVCINPFTPRVSYGDINVILTSEPVDEILWCDHSNETSSAALSHGTIYTLVFFKMKFGISLEF